MHCNRLTAVGTQGKMSSCRSPNRDDGSFRCNTMTGTKAAGSCKCSNRCVITVCLTAVAEWFLHSVHHPKRAGACLTYTDTPTCSVWDRLHVDIMMLLLVALHRGCLVVASSSCSRQLHTPYARASTNTHTTWHTDTCPEPCVWSDASPCLFSRP